MLAPILYHDLLLLVCPLKITQASLCSNNLMGRPEDKSEQLEITEEQKAMRQRVELISLLQFLRQDHDGNTIVLQKVPSEGS